MKFVFLVVWIENGLYRNTLLDSERAAEAFARDLAGANIYKLAARLEPTGTAPVKDKYA